MKGLLMLALPLGVIYLAGQASKKWPSGQATTTPHTVNIGAHQYQVDTTPLGIRVSAYDLQGRAITSVTYGAGRQVVDVSPLGNYPDILVREYHNYLVTDVTQYPEKFGL